AGGAAEVVGRRVREVGPAPAPRSGAGGARGEHADVGAHVELPGVDHHVVHRGVGQVTGAIRPGGPAVVRLEHVADTAAGDPAAGERAVRDDHVAGGGRGGPERGRGGVRQGGGGGAVPPPPQGRVGAGGERLV